jgi:Domain of unknown function (DUF397)
MDTPRQPADDVTADALDGAIWHTSSYSGTSGNCVEVATNLPGLVAVRDSKDPEGAVLVVSSEAWRALTRGIGLGKFTLG